MNRRSNSRILWNRFVKYRRPHTGVYKYGLLKNASVDGAMLWLKEELAVGSSIDILIESKTDPDPMNVHMRVVRSEKTPYEDYIGYGCKLEMTVSDAA